MPKNPRGHSFFVWRKNALAFLRGREAMQHTLVGGIIPRAGVAAGRMAGVMNTGLVVGVSRGRVES